MCVHMCVCGVCMHVSLLYVCVCMHMCVHMCVLVDVCGVTCVYVCVHVVCGCGVALHGMCAYMWVHCVCSCACACVCVHVYTHVRVCTCMVYTCVYVCDACMHVHVCETGPLLERAHWAGSAAAFGLV